MSGEPTCQDLLYYGVEPFNDSIGAVLLLEPV